MECREAVREQLVAPGSAKFDSLLEPPKVTYQGGLWRVSGRMEAQNAYGVTMIGNYRCEVRYRAGRYIVEVADLF